MKMTKYVVKFWVIFFDYVIPYDDTDNKVTKTRSGVNIITDYGTGCQYLYKYFSGMTPRYSGKGDEIVGCYENKQNLGE